jgi:tetratricopeptide (TPR) repeat protein
VLEAIYQADLSTLNQSPDNPDTRRAQAVNLLLLAEAQRQRGQLDEALKTCQQTLAIGTRLVGSGRDEETRREDQRNLAVFYVTEGDILDGLGSTEDEVAAYGQARTAAQRSVDKSDVGTQRYLWFIDLRIANLQQRLRHIDEATTAGTEAVQLAETAAQSRPDPQSRSDLAASYEQMAEVLDAAGEWRQSVGDPAGAKKYWSDGLAELLKSQKLLADLAASTNDPQAQQNLTLIRREVAALQAKAGGGRRAAAEDERHRAFPHA